MNFTPQVQTAEAGAGIVVRPNFLDKDTQEAYNKSLFRYAYSPLEEIPLSDRKLGLNQVLRGRLTLIDNYAYNVPNETDEYILKGNGSPFLVYTKSAYDCADEITGAFQADGTNLVTIIRALTGVQPETAREIERVIMPELPANLRRAAEYLRDVSPTNIARASMPTELESVAENARKEMLQSASECFTFANRYLDRTEREMINSRKSNGHGKSFLDERDRRYYAALARPVPKEADLEYVAETEESHKSTNDSALADAIKMLAEKVGQPAASPVTDPSVQAALNAQADQIARLTALVESLTAKKSGK
jgi:hypothetical protein